jgi:hypothetical protein
MQSNKGSSDTPLGSLKVTDTELPDGSAVFTFEGSDEDMGLIVRAGIRDVINKDLLEVENFLAPNFENLSDDDQVTNYFFAYTVKIGLYNMLGEMEKEKQGSLNLNESTKR